MLFNGKVILMEEHPGAIQLVKMAKLLGGMNEEDLGRKYNIYKKYESTDMDPVDKQDVFKADLVLIHIEQNIFMVHKSHKNPFTEGDTIYLLNEEIKQWKEHNA